MVADGLPLFGFSPELYGNEAALPLVVSSITQTHKLNIWHGQGQPIAGLVLSCLGNFQNTIFYHYVLFHTRLNQTMSCYCGHKIPFLTANLLNNFLYHC